MLRLRRRRRGQSIVEFGLIALTFTLLLFGVVDLGILLNGWLGVSASSRDLARQLAVGICPPVGTQGYIPAQTPPNPTNPCSSGGSGGVPNATAPANLQITGVDWANNPTSGVQISVSVCSIDLGTCYSGQNLWNIFPNGQCDALNQQGNQSACGNPIHPTPNDAIKVTVVAKLQVVTPLVRPFFGCTNGSNPQCDVPITSVAVSRYEGPFI